jgi:hypothetical protein
MNAKKKEKKKKEKKKRHTTVASGTRLPLESISCYHLEK